MKIRKFILDLFTSKSVDEQEQEYLKKYGYPDNTMIFTDSMGRMSQLIGKSTFMSVINSKGYKMIKKGIEEKETNCYE